MLLEHEKWKLQSLDKKETFWIEANFKEDDEETNEGKILKFTFPDGKIAYIKRDDLNQILFAIGTPTDQMKMIPQTLTKVSYEKTRLTLVAEKDFKKGELINFIYTHSPKVIQQDIIGKDKANKSKFII